MDDIKPGSFIYTNNPPVEIKGLMTLRDYFAAKAMQVILKDQYEDGLYVGDVDNDSEHVCANSAYMMADAMLKARMEKNS